MKKYKQELHFNVLYSVQVNVAYYFMRIDLKSGSGSCKKYMDVFRKGIRQARKENVIDPAQMEFFFDDVKINIVKEIFCKNLE